MSDAAEWRVEHDALGEVLVPAHALWQAQTQRAVENFPISGRPVDLELVRAIAAVKAAAAPVNAQLVLDTEQLTIEDAAFELLEAIRGQLHLTDS